jgi:ATP-binding cassette subfamily C protein
MKRFIIVAFFIVFTLSGFGQQSEKNKAFDFSYKSEAYSKISFLIVLIGYEVFRCAGILAVAYDNLSIGMMLAVFGYLWFMMTPLQEVISIQYSYFSAKAALERINEVLSMRKEPMFKHIANPFFEDVTIEVVDLNFGYKDLLFENCNCKIAPHKVTAIIGASGSGKSTFAKLICGFLLPNSGDIKYNKSSYCEIGLDVIRDNVALILQETRLFNDTVLFNLTLGKEFDDLEIVEALKKAEIYNTITAMENGINTMVGKNGVKLSGGQKQRIAIARMLLHKPKIVILDESTSALDIDTEDRVMKNIESFLKSRTSIIIAHRAETIAKADEILMIKDKKIKKL